MTKLSSTISYKLLRKWDRLLRLLPLSHRWEIWSDASGKGYGGHLGPQSKPLDVWQDKHQYLAGGKGSTEYIEAMALLRSLEKWGEGLRGKKVWCYCDNYQVYQVLRRKYELGNLMGLGLGLGLRWKGRGRYFTSNGLWLGAGFGGIATTSIVRSGNTARTDGDIITPKARCPKVTKTFEEIDDLIQKYQITIRARWVWGKDNFLADRLSRLGNGGLTPHVLGLLEAATATSKDGRSQEGEEMGKDTGLT
ncbi:hypothetical protein I302_106694 [Kwoniella bestiolae CBS 10118]|uniref:Uncharacterized protein n=1 Tax=Kwoniella bestiolae CBS 10118 TaxID=1296100 RepID=A0A1B9G0N5_9TREE|nr:hypothetical protein I302_06044 [Kwoniella bestiolae CBS 10118]OCF24583.1 hypothetical protein I302_06044 [Kwoniella bestiolae CBS 10118]